MKQKSRLRTRRNRLGASALCAGLVFACPAPATAQAAFALAGNSLPDAPGTATVSGVVVDRSGAAVEGALVWLIRADGTNLPGVKASPHGEFTLANVSAGTYRLSVQATGFAPYISEPLVLVDGQQYSAPRMELAVATADSQVEVLANDPHVADLQVKEEEKQRVVGIIPNFYVSYVHDPVPMNAKQKYKLALRDTFDPIGFVGAAIGAEAEQLGKTFPGYGYGWAGYGKRYAALYGDGLTADLLSHAVFPQIFHQDPRYFYQGTGSKKSRLKHALAFAFVTRGDNGRTEPNYSYILGNLGSGALSNLYYPHADRGAGLVFANAGLGVLGQMFVGVAEEFILPHFTTNVPKKPKP
ncbi:Carboxypeptidase regulatory-like domain-containing protein [Granulicella rosea]|uniref:Carboxypeptidase regulatory-like domain-containing protein n=1 Tax=Granulicella rosea TaxID=474952 RepID=A0A239DLK1_9BACT|nr:carboxypeptidase-like regulatory domain-containing protein [Granulicella rosea]SNS33515.1 Carboxypeptidase regulatory-like domain-containing protein [Granulicella rosea]